jgi:hypothetical protein
MRAWNASVAAAAWPWMPAIAAALGQFVEMPTGGALHAPRSAPIICHRLAAA